MSLLQDKVIIITGAGRGIGLSLAKHLSALGVSVAIADIDGSAAEAATSQLPLPGLPVTCDVTSALAAKAMVESVTARFGKIDVLINNAGIFPVGLFEDITLEQWRRVLDINLTGTFLCSQAVYPVMRRQGLGKIINMASAAGRAGGVGFAHYAAAKAGVIGLTKSLAREAAAQGIQVNAIAPGIVETDTAKATFPGFALKEYVKQVPQGRLGKEEDLLGLTAFLCSGESGYITGQTFAVDGGYTMI